MTREMEIEEWIVDNLAMNNDEYYIEHKQVTNFFRIKEKPTLKVTIEKWC